MLGDSTVIWLLSECVGFGFITLLCNALLLSFISLFLWSHLASFTNTELVFFFFFLISCICLFHYTSLITFQSLKNCLQILRYESLYILIYRTGSKPLDFAYLGILSGNFIVNFESLYIWIK